MQKKALFIIITTAAKVTDRPLRSRKWGVVKGRSCGGGDRTGDPTLTNAVFHAMLVIPRLKLGDHEGLAFFTRGWPLKWTLLVVLPVILIRIPIHSFLTPVPVYCWGQPRSSWCCSAAAPAPSSGKLSIGFVYFPLFLSLLVLLVKEFCMFSL